MFWYNDFAEYVAAHPLGEAYRAWLTDKPGVIFLKSEDIPHGGLPGGYVWAAALERTWRLRKSQEIKREYVVRVGDNDDGATEKLCASLAEAQRELEDLKLLAPFKLWELAAFGYHSD